MIIKKPYAFMIKHFRLIHLVLLVPMIYLASQTREIMLFFREYAANNYTLGSMSEQLSSLASNYINVLMYVAVLLILIVFIFLTVLLQRKSKPTKFYTTGIVYYLVIFILITVSFSIFKSIENDTLSTAAARIIRDLSIVIHYSQYIFVFLTAIRGVGFNIRQFDFKSDLAELEIDSEDSEEVEFLIGIDSDKAKRNVRRFFRELKYYYKENKFVFIMIGVIIIGVIGTLIYMNKEVYQRVYRETESIALGYLNFQVKDTYLTNLSKDGKVLNDDKYYMVLQLEISNRYREDHNFNYINLELTVNNKFFLPNLSVGSYFSDYGTPYNGTLIKGNTTSDYILVYEIDKYLINQDFELTVFSHYDASAGGIGSINNRIRLEPTKVDEKINNTNISLGEEMDFVNTNLGNSNLTITSYEITSLFQYKYLYCITSDNCIDSTGMVSAKDYRKTLLVLGYDLVLDKDVPYMDSEKTYRTVFEDFVKIEYEVNGKKNTYQAKIANPNTYSEKAIIELPSEISQAEYITIICTVRNLSYRLNIR